MRKSIAWSAILVIGLLAVGSAQGQGDAERFLFIDADETSGFMRGVNVSRVGESLVEAGERGYVLHSMAGSAASLNMLLEYAGPEPQEYRFVHTRSEDGFLEDLNELGAQGFRVVPGTIKAFEDDSPFGGGTEWIAVLVPRAGGVTSAYTLVKGTEDGQHALDAAGAIGRVLVGVVGRQGLTATNTLLFFEEGGARGEVPAATGDVTHRIVTTQRTSTTLDDIQAAAAEGFRVVGSGFGYMTFVLAREPEAASTGMAYRLVATTRVSTSVRELQAAGADGFSVAAMSENGTEGVYILQRPDDNTQSFDYRIEELEEDAANQILLDAEADGYEIVQLYSNLAVLERSYSGEP